MWNKYLLAGALLLLASPAWAMEHYINNLQDRHGDAIGGVTVTVYLNGTLTKATIFSDNGITAKSNPFPSDANGYYDFYASNGVYDFTFVRSGFTFPLAYTRVALFDVNDGGGGGGSSSFSGLLSGTNNSAAMIVGSGASLSATGSGTLSANRYNGNATIAVADGGTNLTSASDDNLMVGNGSTWQAKALPAGCATSTSKLLYDSTTNTISCGTDLSGAATFDLLGSGTNITATMTLGTGSSLTFSGSGTVNASTYKGNATVAATDGGTGQTAVTDDGLLVANGSVFQLKILPGCNNPTVDKLLYDSSANSFSCGVDQSAGGGTTFNTIGSGTNTTATMTVGTGGSITLSGTGNVTANSFWPNLVTVNAGNSPYTALTTNSMIFCDTTGGARIVNLPAATSKVIYTFFNNGSNNCTINRAGADQIFTGITSGSSFIIRNSGTTFWLQPDGVATWYVGG